MTRPDSLHTDDDVAQIRAEIEMRQHIGETWPHVVEMLQEVTDHLADALDAADPLLVKASAVLAWAKGEQP